MLLTSQKQKGTPVLTYDRTARAGGYKTRTENPFKKHEHEREKTEAGRKTGLKLSVRAPPFLPDCAHSAARTTCASAPTYEREAYTCRRASHQPSRQPSHQPSHQPSRQPSHRQLLPGRLPRPRERQRKLHKRPPRSHAPTSPPQLLQSRRLLRRIRPRRWLRTSRKPWP